MKKIVLSIIAAFGLLAGCKTVPSEDTLFSTSYAIGVSTALVMNQIKISDADRNVIIEIMKKVDEAVPQTGKTFTDAWTPIASEYVGQLVADGKIDETQAQLILTIFPSATQTLDYVVYKRYPKVGEDVKYVAAVTHGFNSGFLTHFKPANTMSASNAPLYDAEAYEYMSKLVK